MIQKNSNLEQKKTLFLDQKMALETKVFDLKQENQTFKENLQDL
jgi:hypothetical protein